MDPVSQAALGAVVGQVAGYRRVGPKAAAVGAFAGALPDIDILFSINGSLFDQLVLHRGITHSLFFAPIVGPPLAWVIWRWERRRMGEPSADWRLSNNAPHLLSWTAVVSLALLSHPLLDYLTPYGTQLLLPFSDARFAIAAMPIIDPIYTGILVLGLLWSRYAPDRVMLTAFATLLASSVYLAYSWNLNVSATQQAKHELAAAGITDAQVAAFPTVLQVHYRRVVARTTAVDRVGFISMWQPCPIVWGIAPRADHATKAAFLAMPEGKIFDWFTTGWSHYTADVNQEIQTIRATDLRYGATSDPTKSIFSATMIRQERAAPRISAERSIPTGPELSLAQLAADTYAPTCTLVN